MEPTLGTFCDCSMISGAKVGDSFQVHVFGDPGMEMMKECSGCMCINHAEHMHLLMMSLLTFIHAIGVLSDHFGGPGGHRDTQQAL